MDTAAKWLIGLLVSAVSFLGGNWVHFVDLRLAAVDTLRIQAVEQQTTLKLYMEQQRQILDEVKKTNVKLDAHMTEAHNNGRRR